MPFVPAPNIVQVEFRSTLQDQNIENRLMFNMLSSPSAAEIDELAVNCLAWAAEEYFPLLPADIHLNAVVATDMGEQNGYQKTLVPDPAVNGGQVANAMANQITMAVQLKSASRGRSANGRSFVLGLPSNLVVRNNINNAHADGLVAAFQALIDDTVTDGKQLSIVSYRANKVPRPGGPVYFPVITASVADYLVDSQRRRKPGVGS